MAVVKCGIFARALLLAATVAVSVFAPAAWAQKQPDTAYVPFIVNIDATVEFNCIDHSAAIQCPPVSMQVNGNEETIIRLLMTDYSLGVRFLGAQRQAGVPAIAGGGNGKIFVNLPTQSYKNAEVLLYAVNGKRILRNNVNAASAANMAIRRSLAPGMYLLSVKGEGGALTSKLMHGGGRLDIGVAFGGEEVASGTDRLSKKSARARDYNWNITVSAVESGYVDSTYSLLTVLGMNPVQNITLREK